jgi:uncharacterized protein (TIGR03067 family)
MPTDLEALQGAWTVASLEMDGEAMPEGALGEARIEIEGGRFTSLGMGAEYAGTILLDASAKPRRIDMVFDSGPEAGNTNRGIYELKGKTWRLCLATRGDMRPKAFATEPGSGFALETLQRAGAVKVKPKKASAKSEPEAAPAAGASEIEGEWRMLSGVMNGAAMDESTMQWVRRVNAGDVSTVLAGPQTMLKVRFTLDHSQSPGWIDYVNLYGPNKGKEQQGIFALKKGVLTICVAQPGASRPREFHSAKGDGQTLTVWKRG